MIRSLLSAMLLTISHLALADVPSDYRHLMPLLPQHEGGQHRLILPAEIYLYTEQPNLADLRIFNSSRESLPFAFSSEPADPPPKPAPQTLNWFALSDSDKHGENVHLSVKLQPDGTLTAFRNQLPPVSAQVKRYLVDASRLKQPVRALEIDAEDTLGNTLHHLTIEGSDDLRNWRILADHAPWLDLHSDAGQLAQKRIEFPPSHSKYFRLSWDDNPIPLKQVMVETTADSSPVNYLKRILQVPQLQPESPDYEFELPPAICLERLRLILPQQDSVASIQIFTRRAQRDTWQSVSSATFYRISREENEIVSPAQSLSGIRSRYWRIHLDRYSAAHPAMLQLEIGWRQHQVVFLASGSAPYTLAFGNRQAKVASFPLTTLLPDYHTGNELELPLASTGALVSREAAGDSDSFMEKWREMKWKPLLLWVILICGVALLGWMAWHIRKELERR